MTVISTFYSLLPSNDSEGSFPDQALLAKDPLKQPTYPPILAIYVNHFVYF